jgi:hypothetical protein
MRSDNIDGSNAHMETLQVHARSARGSMMDAVVIPSSVAASDVAPTVFYRDQWHSTRESDAMENAALLCLLQHVPGCMESRSSGSVDGFWLVPTGIKLYTSGPGDRDVFSCVKLMQVNGRTLSPCPRTSPVVLSARGNEAMHGGDISTLCMRDLPTMQMVRSLPGLCERKAKGLAFSTKDCSQTARRR